MSKPITARNQDKLIAAPWPNGLNCYSFAAKCQNPGGVGLVACVPGAVAGAPVSAATITPELLFRACVADGFEDASGGVLSSQHKFSNLPPSVAGKYLIAVFYDARRSFHFARQVGDGTLATRQWVHKPSAAQDAHNMQGGHVLLEDPSDAPWGPHFQFVGYLRAPQNGLTVNRSAF